MERELDKLRAALQWCSGAPAFALGGEAREGWERLCVPLLRGDDPGVLVEDLRLMELRNLLGQIERPTVEWSPDPLAMRDGLIEAMRKTAAVAAKTVAGWQRPLVSGHARAEAYLRLGLAPALRRASHEFDAVRYQEPTRRRLGDRVLSIDSGMLAAAAALERMEEEPDHEAFVGLCVSFAERFGRRLYSTAMRLARIAEEAGVLPAPEAWSKLRGDVSGPGGSDRSTWTVSKPSDYRARGQWGFVVGDEPVGVREAMCEGHLYRLVGEHLWRGAWAAAGGWTWNPVGRLSDLIDGGKTFAFTGADAAREAGEAFKEACRIATQPSPLAASTKARAEAARRMAVFTPVRDNSSLRVDVPCEACDRRLDAHISVDGPSFVSSITLRSVRCSCGAAYDIRADVGGGRAVATRVREGGEGGVYADFDPSDRVAVARRLEELRGRAVATLDEMLAVMRATPGISRRAPDMVEQLARDLGGSVAEVGEAGDGSGFAVVELPLPEGHWSTSPSPGFQPPPMPWRCGSEQSVTIRGDRRQLSADIVAAARHAYRGATINGTASLDPDALVQNLVVALLGYASPNGLSGDAWANPEPVPNPERRVLEPLSPQEAELLAACRSNDHLRDFLHDVAGERVRQVAGEGWTFAHDDRHRFGELAKAAAAYAVHDTDAVVSDPGWEEGQDYPWPDEDNRSKGNTMRRLVVAGALLAAEAGRLRRQDEQEF